MRQKLNRRKKEYSALNVHIASPEMNNLILATCYTDTYANQSLYTNLVNNFARLEMSMYVDATKLQVHNIISSNKVISQVSFPRGLDKTNTKIIVNL